MDRFCLSNRVGGKGAGVWAVIIWVEDAVDAVVEELWDDWFCRLSGRAAHLADHPDIEGKELLVCQPRWILRAFAVAINDDPLMPDVDVGGECAW